jgi:hypothetical protein
MGRSITSRELNLFSFLFRTFARVNHREKPEFRAGMEESTFKSLAAGRHGV